MKVALYARVSTADKEQDPETQLIHLRDYCIAQGWEVHYEYVDTASALDVAHRTAWRKMLDDDAKRRFRTVLVFKLDRAFRSVKHMHDTLYTWETLGIAFKSRYRTIVERLSAGDISRRQAAKELGIGYATLKRLLDSNLNPS